MTKERMTKQRVTINETASDETASDETASDETASDATETVRSQAELRIFRMCRCRWRLAYETVLLASHQRDGVIDVLPLSLAPRPRDGRTDAISLG